LLNAVSGVRRVMRRLPRTSSRRPASAIRPSLPLRRRVENGLRAAAVAAHLFPSRISRRTQPDVASIGRAAGGPPGLLARLGQERVCALVVAGLVLGATGISAVPPAAPEASPTLASVELPYTGPFGGPDGDAAAPRIVVGGAFGIDRTGIVYDRSDGTDTTNAYRDLGPLTELDAAALPAEVSGPFLEDGTLLKPVSVDTTVDDAKEMLRTYKVKSGDTLAKVASRFDVSVATIYWANKLTSRTLKSGRQLTIPPVDGLVVTVRPSDTLEILAARHKVKEEAILEANKLEDRNLVMGQVLLMPGAKGAPLPKPKPKPTVAPKSTVSSGGPAQYSGGRFAWPVAGGYISQYFHYGHYGLDIAADPGTAVKAGASGKVIFAGWKSNGGGYQVWISHGSGLYTTYNHMSSVSVGSGQSVGRGQRVGRVGSTGYATGPHLHFEVWKGAIWNGGTRVNPLGYL